MEQIKPTPSEYSKFQEMVANREAVAHGATPYLIVAGGSLVLAKHCASCISYDDAVTKIQQQVGDIPVDLSSGTCSTHLQELRKGMI